MDSHQGSPGRPHALCIPMPYQSHINAMLKFAKLLHSRGFRVTFVNNEFNHDRLLKSGGPRALDGLPDFHFRAIPDGLPPSDPDASQDGALVCEAVRNSMSAPFFNLVADINRHSDKVTCIISDGFISFTTYPVAEKLGIPIVLFWSISACSLLAFKYFPLLIEKGLIPLKDINYLTDGYLDQLVDCIPGMKSIRLKDLPTYLRTTDPNDIRFNFIMDAVVRSVKSSAIVIHTFDELESDTVRALSSEYSQPVYRIGPLQLLLQKAAADDRLKSIEASLWKEDMECLRWLDSREPNSVIYVNFGSIASMTRSHLIEFAMGLANSKHPFLWIIRPDIVKGEKVNLPPEFFVEMGGRGMLSEWCPQLEVLRHPSTGGFLTHCGWSSVVESVTAGVPMICWPSFGDQSTNCMYICREWGVGIELDREFKREQLGRLVRELMGGDKGKEMKRRAAEWKKLAEEATDPTGSSPTDLDKLINEVLK